MESWTVSKLTRYKKEGKKFACLTAYDATQARVLSEAGIEVLLVGDSLGHVVQGNNSTLTVSLDEMVYHTRAVAQGNINALLMADIPFGCAYDMISSLESARRLMQAGADVIKFEVDTEMLPVLAKLSQQGVLLCAHIGLRPQQAVKEGGYRVKGRAKEEAAKMLKLAKECEEAGADFLLLECVVASLAEQITQSVNIPVIGIGAGAGTDAQILVVYDMLGLHPNPPKFVRNFMEGCTCLPDAVKAYHSAVIEGQFPMAREAYGEI